MPASMARMLGPSAQASIAVCSDLGTSVISLSAYADPQAAPSGRDLRVRGQVSNWPDTRPELPSSGDAAPPLSSSYPNCGFLVHCGKTDLGTSVISVPRGRIRRSRADVACGVHRTVESYSNDKETRNKVGRPNSVKFRKGEGERIITARGIRSELSGQPSARRFAAGHLGMALSGAYCH